MLGRKGLNDCNARFNIRCVLVFLSMILSFNLQIFHTAFAEVSGNPDPSTKSQERDFEIAKTIVFFRSMDKYCRRYAINTKADEYLKLWLPKFGVSEREVEKGQRFSQSYKEAVITVQKDITRMTMVGWCLNNLRAARKTSWLQPYITTNLPMVSAYTESVSPDTQTPKSSYLVLAALRIAASECKQLGYTFKPDIWKDLARFLYSFSEKEFLRGGKEVPFAERTNAQIRGELKKMGLAKWCSKVFSGFVNKNLGGLLVSKSTN